MASTGRSRPALRRPATSRSVNPMPNRIRSGACSAASPAMAAGDSGAGQRIARSRCGTPWWRRGRPSVANASSEPAPSVDRSQFSVEGAGLGEHLERRRRTVLRRSLLRTPMWSSPCQITFACSSSSTMSLWASPSSTTILRRLPGWEPALTERISWPEPARADVVGVEAQVGGGRLLDRLRLGGHDPLEGGVAGLDGARGHRHQGRAAGTRRRRSPLAEMRSTLSVPSTSSTLRANVSDGRPSRAAICCGTTPV